MESQLTLVNPAPPVSFTFATNSMINTTLYRDSRPAYTLSTELQGSTTELRASDTSELLARISRKEILPDTITFPSINDGKEMRLSKWMRRCKLPDGRYDGTLLGCCVPMCFSHAHAIDTEVGVCLLKKHRIHRLAVRDQCTSPCRLMY